MQVRLIIPGLLLMSFFLQAEGQIPEVQSQVPYGNNKTAGHYLATRGFKLYYEVYGKGKPLLLLHTNGGSISQFGNQIPYFSRSYKVIAIDSRAHGKSADPGDSLTFEMMADDVNVLLDSLHLDSCYVIGWSDGGITGLVLAMHYPGKVKKLAVTGPNLWPDTTGLVPWVYHYVQAFADSLHHLQPLSRENKNLLKITELDLFEPHITLAQLHAIKCPTLVIGGDHDAIPSFHLWQIAQHIPESYLWIIPNSGHSTPVFKKDQFNRVVGDFFSQPYRKIEKLDLFR